MCSIYVGYSYAIKITNNRLCTCTFIVRTVSNSLVIFSFDEKCFVKINSMKKYLLHRYTAIFFYGVKLIELNKSQLYSYC